MDFQKLSIDIRFDEPGSYFLWTTGKGSAVGKISHCETENDLKAKVERAYTANDYSVQDRLASGDRLVAKRKGIIKYGS